jgi:hypothetical protein
MSRPFAYQGYFVLAQAIPQGSPDGLSVHLMAEVRGDRTHLSRRKPGHTGFEDQENHQTLSTSGVGGQRGKI